MRVLILCSLSAGFMALSSCIGAVQPPQEDDNSDQVQVSSADNNSGLTYTFVELIPPNQNCTTNYDTEIPQNTGTFKLCVSECTSRTNILLKKAPISCLNNQPVCPQDFKQTGKCLVQAEPISQQCSVTTLQFPLNPEKYKICGLKPLSF